MARLPLPLVLIVLGCASGCRTRRTLEITSTPPGAEVLLDDDAVGQTPVRVAFEHFGTRRVVFHLPGYRTATQRIKLRPPWYGYFPLDIVSEVLLPIGLRDRRKVHADLVAGEEVMSLPSLRSVIERADALRHAGPEGPRDLPESQPSVVPSEPGSEGDPDPPRPPPPPAPEPAPRNASAGA